MLVKLKMTLILVAFLLVSANDINADQFAGEVRPIHAEPLGHSLLPILEPIERDTGRDSMQIFELAVSCFHWDVHVWRNICLCGLIARS